MTKPLRSSWLREARCPKPPPSWGAALAGLACATLVSSVAVAQPGVPSGTPQPSGASAAPATQVDPGPKPADANAIGVPSVAVALERIHAAYEYGDIDEVVQWSREVTEGRLHPTPQERAYGLRYLGVGLFLTRRVEGAENAFLELLRARPDIRLDPKTTRPDVVAFFEQVRQRHAGEIQLAARANNHKVFLWNFLPPIAQFQNGHRAVGITIGGLELVSLGTAAVTYGILTHWQRPDDTFPDHEDAARALKIVNWVAVGILVATYAFGVIDGIAHYSDLPVEDTQPLAAGPPNSFSVAPTIGQPSAWSF